MNSLVVLFSVVALAAAKPSGLLNAGVISYGAPAVATLPVAVSQQSRIDINSPPTIISTVPAATPLTIGAAPLTAAAIAPTLIRSSPIATPVIAPGVLGTSAIASPALVGPALAPGIPLGASQVIAAGALPLQASTLAGAHLIRKRSAPLLTSPIISTGPVVSTYSATPVISTLPAGPIVSPIGISPLALSSPLIARAW
ncbi:calphotin-like [Achroia grisella]|uniref:calphotin-like n=1 Tax=Achroia grisella TaxID=688607 RepID=UPI0027D26552|nr:calphotin-like [Achroia grisella]